MMSCSWREASFGWPRIETWSKVHQEGDRQRTRQADRTRTRREVLSVFAEEQRRHSVTRDQKRLLDDIRNIWPSLNSGRLTLPPAAGSMVSNEKGGVSGRSGTSALSMTVTDWDIWSLPEAASLVGLVGTDMTRKER